MSVSPTRIRYPEHRESGRSDHSPGAHLNSSRNLNLGIAFLVASNGLTATVDSAAKYLSAELHTIQIVWGYFLVISLLLVAHGQARGVPISRGLWSHRPGLQMLRSAMLVLTIAFLFLGLVHIPLADAIALSFTAPLFITLLSVPILGERVGWHRLGAVVLGLVGVVVALRPGEGSIHWAAFMPLVSAVFFALFQIMTRLLVATEDTYTTLNYTGLGGLLWSSLAVGFFWRDISLEHAAIFVFIGALGVAAHVCMIKAYELAQASLLAPFNYAKLLWAIALGYALFGHVPDWHVITGGAIIVASGLYVFHRERRLHG